MQFNLNEVYSQHKDEIINEIKQYVSILSDYDQNSVSDSKPFGSKIASMFEYIKNKCDEDGIEYRDIDGYALEIVLGTKTDETFGVLSHIDTVPLAENWDTNALELTLKDGWYYGLGTADDKGASAIIYVLIKYLNSLNLEYKRQIKFVLGGSEERGFQCLEYYFSNNEYMTYGVSPDGSFPGINFEKSLYDFEISRKFEQTTNSDITITKITSGSASNVVPQFCEVKLEASDNSKNNLIDKLNDYDVEYTNSDNEFTIKFVGKPAHASTPENGVNSIYKFVHFINEFKLDSNSRIIIDDLIKTTLDDINGDKLGINVENKNGNTTSTLAILNYSDNNLKFVLNIRFTDALNSSEVESKVTSAFENYDVNASGKNYHYIEEDSYIYNQTTTAFKNATGISELPTSTGGGTYARMLSTGMAFGPNLEEDINMHQANERISEKSIEATFKVYLELINNVCVK